MLLPVALLSSGCISTENDRDTLGRSAPIEAFTPVPPAMPPGEPALTPPQQPSVVSLERSNWAATPFLVPVDGTAHHPTYTTRVVIADETARQRREYPTALSALELTAGSERDQQLEVPANWLATLLDPILFLPRLIWEHPWSPRWSPDEAYTRYWHPERPAPLVTEEPPATAPATQPAPTPVTP